WISESDSLMRVLGHVRASLRESSLTLAMKTQASALSMVASKSLARRRLRLSQAMVRVVDERLVAGDMVLAHGRRQAMLEVAVELAKPGIAVAVGMGVAVLLPEHRQADARPLHVAGQRRPVGLDAPTKARLGAGTGEQPLLDRLVGELVRQRPRQLGRRRAGQVLLHGASGDAEFAGNGPIARPGCKV